MPNDEKHRYRPELPKQSPESENLRNKIDWRNPIRSLIDLIPGWLLVTLILGTFAIVGICTGYTPP